jgi:hypothetical protein
MFRAARGFAIRALRCPALAAVDRVGEVAALAGYFA